MRKICVFTGTRAEYGLLRWVMQGIQDAPDLTLQIVATGCTPYNLNGAAHSCPPSSEISLSNI